MFHLYLTFYPDSKRLFNIYIYLSFVLVVTDDVNTNISFRLILVFC